MTRVAKLYHFREMWNAEASNFEEVVNGMVSIAGSPPTPVEELVFTRKGVIAGIDEEVAEATYLFMVKQWWTKTEEQRPPDFRVWLETEEWVRNRVTPVLKIPVPSIWIADLGEDTDLIDPVDLRLTLRRLVVGKLTEGPRYRELTLPSIQVN